MLRSWSRLVSLSREADADSRCARSYDCTDDAESVDAVEPLPEEMDALTAISSLSVVVTSFSWRAARIFWEGSDASETSTTPPLSTDDL